MAKKIEYHCSNCSYISDTRFNMCPECKDGFSEKIIKDETKQVNKLITQTTNVSTLKQEHLNDKLLIKVQSTIQPLKVISNTTRFMTQMPTVNTLFGNGIMPYSFNLVGGTPGIGKTTFLMKLLDELSSFKKDDGNTLKCAYISAEENVEQLYKKKERFDLTTEFFLIQENDTKKIIDDYIPLFDVLVIDSINTIGFMDNTNIVGGISQIRDSTMALMQTSKNQYKTIFLVSQVNKDEELAGPKMLEHMVDTVLFFENYDENGIYRLVRSNKNRFGNINEISIFKMEEKGLIEIENPATLFVNNTKGLVGCTTTGILQNSKPIFLEIQALVQPTSADKTFIQSIGVDTKRIFQIVAILQKYLGFKPSQYNIFINIVGGLTTKSTNLDLAIACAILSSEKNKPIDGLFLGELGLTGEIKKQNYEQELINNGNKFGYSNIISNSTNFKHISDLKKLF